MCIYYHVYYYVYLTKTDICVGNKIYFNIQGNPKATIKHSKYSFNKSFNKV